MSGADRSSDAPPPRIWHSLRAGWSLLAPGERGTAILLAAAIVAAGLVDLAALSSVMPVVNLVIDPAVLETNQHARRLHALLGDPPLRTVILGACAVSIGLLLFSTVLRLATEYATIRFASRCQTRLATDLLRGCIEAPYEWMLGQNATLLTRLIYSDVGMWGNNFVRRVGLMLNAVVTMVLSVVLVVVAATGETLAVLGAIAATAAVMMRGLRPTLGRLATRQRTEVDRIALAANQALAGVKDVKLSGNADAVIGVFRGAYLGATTANARMQSLRQFPTATVMFLGQAGLVAVAVLMWMSGADRGQITAHMALLVMASSRLIPAISRLSGNIGALWDALPYFDGLVSLRRQVAAGERMEPGRAGAPATGDAIGQWSEIRLNAVTFHYPGAEEPSLESVSLGIERGRSYGIVGPSGAGKSTVIDLLAGLLVPTAGTITIDGRSLDPGQAPSWMARIGYVPQAPFIADDSLRANIAFGVPPTQVDEQRLRTCIDIALLGDVVADLPGGLDTRLGDRGIRLSGGQRQRIAIARALYQQPELLILDEATSALDTISEARVQAAIDGLRGTVTTITIAHRLSTVRNADRIFLLQRGRLVDSGTFQHLQDNNPMFGALVAATGPDGTTTE